jgi:hypothetical protein
VQEEDGANFPQGPEYSFLFLQGGHHKGWLTSAVQHIVLPPIGNSI